MNNVEQCEMYKHNEPGAWNSGDPIHITPGNPLEAKKIYTQLEAPNWAPWLEASAETIAGRATVFPEGQLVMKSTQGELLASLSLNKIIWDGQIAHMPPTWDAVAGDPTDYSKTYEDDGNTLVLLSMNVSPYHHGKHIPIVMIEAAQQLAHHLGVEYIIGPFRPSKYGKTKGDHSGLSFIDYIAWKRPDGGIYDSWLNTLAHAGMEQLAIATNAMQVTVDAKTFFQYRMTYNPLQWKQQGKTWECGEVGVWTGDATTELFTYREDNVWGKLPL